MDFAGFIDGAFTAFARDLPRPYRHLCGDLSGFGVELRVGSEHIGLRFNHAGHRLGSSGCLAAPLHARLETTHAVVLRLAGGEVDLLSAVRDDSVLLYGDAADLSRFHEALLRFVNLMMKCAAAQQEFKRYRDSHGRRQS